jgi:chromosome segregation ATPase
MPTLTLLAFVVIQFVLNILHYIPAKYWQNWVDRTRYVLKSLLDVSGLPPRACRPRCTHAPSSHDSLCITQGDYRQERYQIDLLRQRLAESDRRNATVVQELDVSQETVRSLRERIVTQSNECDAHKGLYESEAARLGRQLEAQGKLLVETEALLEALRSGDTTRLSRLGSEDRNAYVDRIKHLEEHVATLTKERREISEEVQKLQGIHKSVQDHCDRILHTNTQLQTEKEDLVKQLKAMEAMEIRLTESRNDALTRLNQALQYSTATNSASETQRSELLRQLDDAVSAKNEAERRLQEKEQQPVTVDSGSKETSETYAQLQERIKALEGSSFPAFNL